MTTWYLVLVLGPGQTSLTIRPHMRTFFVNVYAIRTVEDVYAKKALGKLNWTVTGKEVSPR